MLWEISKLSIVLAPNLPNAGDVYSLQTIWHISLSGSSPKSAAVFEPWRFPIPIATFLRLSVV